MQDYYCTSTTCNENNLHYFLNSDNCRLTTICCTIVLSETYSWDRGINNDSSR